MRAICDLIHYPTDNHDVTMARLLVTSHGSYVTRDRTVEMNRLIMTATLHYVMRYVTLSSVAQHAATPFFHEQLARYPSDSFVLQFTFGNVAYISLLYIALSRDLSRFEIISLTSPFIRTIYIPQPPFAVEARET